MRMVTADNAFFGIEDIIDSFYFKRDVFICFESDEGATGVAFYLKIYYSHIIASKSLLSI
jgi:hypothetical protein